MKENIPEEHERLRAVVKLLGFKRMDVAKASGILPCEVSFSGNIKPALLSALRQLELIYLIVLAYFKGDKSKTKKWFRASNPLLGGLSPRETIILGKGARLLRFVQTSEQENKQ